MDLDGSDGVTQMDEYESRFRSGDLARRVLHRSEELSLTREEVARRAGMDPGYLDYLEHSPAAALSSGALLRLAAALETTPASLAGGDRGRPPGAGRAGSHPALETLTTAQCEAHLLAGGIGRVVFSADRGPVALPVNFAFAEHGIVFRTEASTSLALRDGSPVGFEVDHIDEAMSEGWSVLVSGHVERVEDPAQLAAIRVEPWVGGTRETVIRIVIDDISGRFLNQSL